MLAQRGGDQGLDHEARIDDLVRHGRERIGNAHVPQRHVREGEIRFCEHRSRHQVRIVAAPKSEADLLPLQVGRRPDRARIHQVGAGHDRDQAVAFASQMGEVRDDANVDAAVERVEQGCVQGAACGLDPVLGERRDELVPGPSRHRLDLNAVLIEIPSLQRQHQERGIGPAGDSELHRRLGPAPRLHALCGGAGYPGQGGAGDDDETGNCRDLPRPPGHDRSLSCVVSTPEPLPGRFRVYR